MKILAIDPGHQGAFVLYDGKKLFKWWAMPLDKDGKNKSVSYIKVVDLLNPIIKKYPDLHFYLERAVPMAMGSRHAFNYGRDFCKLEIAIEYSGLPVTYVEPAKWTKIMHEGISKDLKSKAKSLIAVKRLLPKLVGELPVNTKGALLDGPVDALLIATYALRTHTGREGKRLVSDDFF
jgi:hypothetical protein